MKKLAFRIVVFVLPVLFLLILLEYYVEKIPNDYKYKKQQFFKKAGETEILVLGGSHSYYGINPEFFSRKTFNLAYVSQPIDFDYELLKLTSEHLPQLKEVILMIAYPTFSNEFDQGEIYWRQYYYYRNWDFGSFRKKYSPKTWSEVFQLRIMRSIDKFSRYYIHKNNLLTSTGFGWGNNYKSELSKDLFNSSAKAYKRHEDFSMDFDEKTKVLENIIKLCKNKGVNVTLISFPLSEPYYHMLNKQKVKKIGDICMTLTEKYPNTRYLNYNTDSRFNETDFYDSDHLNDAGAVKFSIILNDTLTKLNKEVAR